MRVLARLFEIAVFLWSLLILFGMCSGFYDAVKDDPSVSGVEVYGMLAGLVLWFVLWAVVALPLFLISVVLRPRK